ncbi:MAG: hypothetical protein ACTSWD_02505 [Candidatus Heimdallarchaeota archaeon]
MTILKLENYDQRVKELQKHFTLTQAQYIADYELTKEIDKRN